MECVWDIRDEKAFATAATNKKSHNGGMKTVTITLTDDQGAQLET